MSINLACQAIVSLVAPIFIAKVGTKWMMVIGQLGWCVYVASNLYPKPSILLLASILIGVLSGLYWVAESIHITTTAIHLASETGNQNAANIVTRFTGIKVWFQKFSVIPGMIAFIKS